MHENYEAKMLLEGEKKMAHETAEKARQMIKVRVSLVYRKIPIISHTPYFDVSFLHILLNMKKTFMSRSMTSDMPVMKNVHFYSTLGAFNEYRQMC